MSLWQTIRGADLLGQAPKRVCLIDIRLQFDDTEGRESEGCQPTLLSSIRPTSAEARRKKGISQELVADELGLSRTSITNIEKGRQPVQLHSVYCIARLVGVELKDLLPSPHIFETPRRSERLSVSRSEWLETMNVTLPKGLLNAPKRIECAARYLRRMQLRGRPFRSRNLPTRSTLTFATRKVPTMCPEVHP